MCKRLLVFVATILLLSSVGFASIGYVQNYSAVVSYGVMGSGPVGSAAGCNMVMVSHCQYVSCSTSCKPQCSKPCQPCLSTCKPCVIHWRPCVVRPWRLSPILWRLHSKPCRPPCPQPGRPSCIARGGDAVATAIGGDGTACAIAHAVGGDAVAVIN